MSIGSKSIGSYEITKKTRKRSRSRSMRRSRTKAEMAAQAYWDNEQKLDLKCAIAGAENSF